MTHTTCTSITKVLFLALLIFLLFPSAILAAPTIIISTSPPSATAGNEFNISFSSTNLDIGSNYYYKALGGENFYEVDTWSDKTLSWQTWNDSWSNMPELTPDASGSAAVSVKARFQSDTSSGSKELKVRIRKIGAETNYDSDTVSISITAATPTPTAAPTQAPTSTPVPTTAPTTAPTKAPTPKPTVKPTVKASPSPSPEVLGEETSAPSATPTPSPSPAPSSGPNVSVLPFIMIGVGVVSIGGALFPFLKSKLKEYNNSNAQDN